MQKKSVTVTSDLKLVIEQGRKSDVKRNMVLEEGDIII